jgi:hypothetical protein
MLNVKASLRPLGFLIPDLCPAGVEGGTQGDGRSLTPHVQHHAGHGCPVGDKDQQGHQRALPITHSITPFHDLSEGAQRLGLSLERGSAQESYSGGLPCSAWAAPRELLERRRVPEDYKRLKLVDSGARAVRSRIS